MQLDGEEMKQRYGPKITARRRKPTPKENDLQLFEMQRAILGPTYTDEEFMERKNASANWPKQPGDGEVPAYTDWRTVPGYPKLPTNASGQVAKDQNQVASDYSLMRAPGALKSVISKVISALGVTRSVGYKAATYTLNNPTLILQFGAIGLTIPDLELLGAYRGECVQGIGMASGIRDEGQCTRLSVHAERRP